VPAHRDRTEVEELQFSAQGTLYISMSPVAYIVPGEIPVRSAVAVFSRPFSA
jgi:hypothetical protein